MQEIELKFLVEEAELRDIKKRAEKFAPGKPHTALLRSLYIDTSGHDLAEAGYALRRRRSGRRWVQTVKARPEISSGLSRAAEFEAPAPRGLISLDLIPDEAVRRELEKLIAGKPLEVICETRIRRTSLVLDRPGGRAEMALDAGDIVAGERSFRIREVELELREGEPALLFDLARELFAGLPIRFSRLSKAQRGYRLANAKADDAPLAPRNAKAVDLDPKASPDAAFQAMLRECLDQIAVNVEATMRLDEIEGIHQLRVGLRRLRSLLRVFRPLAGANPETARLDEEAKWLSGEAGKLRDADVLAHDIVLKLADDHPDEVGLTELGEALLGSAAAKRRHLVKLLAMPRVSSFVIDLARFTETRGWVVPDGEPADTSLTDFAAKALKKRWKAVQSAGKIDLLTPEQRHELRKDLKKLRYAVEFLAPLFPGKSVKPYLKRLKALQEVFGHLNDAAMTHGYFTSGDASKTVKRAPYAVGWVIGATQARADLHWRDAKRLWRDLKDAKAFWK